MLRLQMVAPSAGARRCARLWGLVVWRLGLRQLAATGVQRNVEADAVVHFRALATENTPHSKALS